MIGAKTQPETSISARELHRRHAAGDEFELIDVRTPAEYASVYVAGARLIPLGDLNAEAFCREQARQCRPVYVFCQSGVRARKAVERIRAAGFIHCAAVDGGIEAWMQAGLPVERGEPSGLPLMRQVQIVVGLVSFAGAALALAVDPLFAFIPLVMGSGLLFAGLTGICGLALLLAKMPWNRAAHLDPAPPKVSNKSS